MKLKLPKNGSEWRLMFTFRWGKRMFNPLWQIRTDGVDDIIKNKEARGEYKRNKKLVTKHR